ncbi:MAG: alpha-glucosidase [Lachnospiraceae bacterium]|nr:alpha-glucosidase [Lachnospiraceae bacterium]
MNSFAVINREDITYERTDPDKTQSRGFTWDLDEDDVIYGLGETMGGMDKRGRTFVSYNTDDSHHRPDMPSMYGSHNFFIVEGKSSHFGIFVDSPARVTFSFDDIKKGQVYVLVESPDVAIYTIVEDNAYQITRTFLKMIGPSFAPPLWAFGFGQSRWGYKNKRDINRVIRGYKNANLPLDYVCLDIDYMDRYIDFTVNKKRFPDMASFVEEKKNEGIHLVPIVDAGVKVEPGDQTYDEGVRYNYFCRNEKGKFFKAAVWPGMTHFPDFFRENVRRWFGGRYKALTDLGFEGFWNDMNEPAIFYGENSKQQSFLDMVLDFFLPSRGEKKEGAKSNAYEEYEHFYHVIGGIEVCHHDVHNLYGAQMMKASGEGLKQLLDKRYLLFSRSSYIGAHRYGGIWTGDNSSTFFMLRQNLIHMASLNMCGFIYSGADTGGFGGNCTKELLLRWLALSDFTPLMRDHSAIATRKQECYAFGDPEDFRKVLSLRYRLIPYIYSEFMKARANCDMYMMPLSFGYPGDEKARRIEDQLLVGEGVMIAPIMKEGALSRKVYLPEEMMEVRYNGNGFRQEVCPAGERVVKVPLHEVVFYIRKNKAIVVSNKGVQNTGQLNLYDVVKLGYDVPYDQYLDDGITPVA